MSLVSKLKRGVDVAFERLGDLVYDGLLIPKRQEGYDWSTNSLSGALGETKPIKVIFYQESRALDGNSGSTIVYKAIVKSAEFDRGLYDQIQIGDDLYDISSFEDYVVAAELNLTRVSR